MDQDLGLFAERALAIFLEARERNIQGVTISVPGLLAMNDLLAEVVIELATEGPAEALIFYEAQAKIILLYRTILEAYEDSVQGADAIEDILRDAAG